MPTLAHVVPLCYLHAIMILPAPTPSRPAATTDPASSLIAFSWLLHLRWGAMACQVLLISAVALFYDISVPLPILSAILLFEAASNLFFAHLQQRKKAISETLFALVMFLDVALFTALLHFTGGAMNPFTFLYLVHIVLAAILMRPRWSWALTITAIGCYGLLFILPADSMLNQVTGGTNQPIRMVCVDYAGLDKHLTLHLHGMWVGFTITALFIVFFVGRIQQALATHETALTQLREEKSRADRLASLATLAAGAAHEFSTPLATITVAAGEMLHTLKELGNQEELLEDALLIRDQVNRCKDILCQMSSDAGEHLGESFAAFTLAELFEALRATLGNEASSRVDILCEEEHLRLKMPSRSLKRSLKGLVSNGLDASGSHGRVTLRCWSDPTRLWFEVKDTGLGMTGEISDRAVEPFFTTKAPGQGLGLGLFLAKSLAESFGGDLAIESTLGQGTTIHLWFDLKEVLA